MLTEKGDMQVSRQVIWTKHVQTTFVIEGNLTDFEAEVLDLRVKNKTITEMSMQLNCSRSLIDKTIKKLKIKYDEVQKHHPDDMPVRRSSAKELYMDTH